MKTQIKSTYPTSHGCTGQGMSCPRRAELNAYMAQAIYSPEKERKGQGQTCPVSSPKLTNQINRCSSPRPSDWAERSTEYYTCTHPSTWTETSGLGNRCSLKGIRLCAGHKQDQFWPWWKHRFVCLSIDWASSLASPVRAPGIEMGREFEGTRA